MPSKTKTTLLLFTLISGAIWLAGCKKTNDSILGTWSYVGYAVSTYTNTTQPYDTAVTTTDGILTFSSAGTFISTFDSSLHTEPLNLFATHYPYTAYTINGNYTYANSVLSFTDTISGNLPYGGKVISLSSHALSIQLIDSYNVSGYNTTYIKYTFNYSR